MTRRTALAFSTSVALAAAAATFAVGTTLGLFGAARTSGPTGELSPVADAPSETPKVQTVYVDVTEPPQPPAPRSTRVTAPPQPVEEVVVVEDGPTPAATHSEPADDSGAHESESPDGGFEGDD